MAYTPLYTTGDVQGATVDTLVIGIITISSFASLIVLIWILGYIMKKGKELRR